MVPRLRIPRFEGHQGRQGRRLEVFAHGRSTGPDRRPGGGVGRASCTSTAARPPSRYLPARLGRRRQRLAIASVRSSTGCTPRQPLAPPLVLAATVQRSSSSRRMGPARGGEGRGLAQDDAARRRGVLTHAHHLGVAEAAPVARLLERVKRLRTTATCRSKRAGHNGLHRLTSRVGTGGTPPSRSTSSRSGRDRAARSAPGRTVFRPRARRG